MQPAGAVNTLHIFRPIEGSLYQLSLLTPNLAAEPVVAKQDETPANEQPAGDVQEGEEVADEGAEGMQ